jgi:nitrite reductase/ring-hydroxylating ferredoxin subunit
MTFVLNTWYCAGWASELLEKPKAITICGRGIMLFRDSAGDAYAMEDRCPHRFARSHKVKSLEIGSSAPTTGWSLIGVGPASSIHMGNK